VSFSLSVSICLDACEKFCLSATSMVHYLSEQLWQLRTQYQKLYTILLKQWIAKIAIWTLEQQKKPKEPHADFSINCHA
ncbi:MAG: hypothetical protein LUF89_05925, partial [Ruminococcus sp.]|nr:hypothetical protein [Ruminococcus sp.]